MLSMQPFDYIYNRALVKRLSDRIIAVTRLLIEDGVEKDHNLMHRENPSWNWVSMNGEITYEMVVANPEREWECEELACREFGPKLYLGTPTESAIEFKLYKNPAFPFDKLMEFPCMQLILKSIEGGKNLLYPNHYRDCKMCTTLTSVLVCRPEFNLEMFKKFYPFMHFDRRYCLMVMNIPLEDLVRFHRIYTPDVETDEIFSNQNISLDQLFNYNPVMFQRWLFTCANIGYYPRKEMTIEWLESKTLPEGRPMLEYIIATYPRYYYNILSFDKRLTEELFEQNLDAKWSWEGICMNKNISDELLLKHILYGRLGKPNMIKHFLRLRNVTWDLIMEHKIFLHNYLFFTVNNNAFEKNLIRNEHRKRYMRIALCSIISSGKHILNDLAIITFYFI